MEVFLKNPLFVGVRIPEVSKTTPLESKLPNVAQDAMSWLRVSEGVCAPMAKGVGNKHVLSQNSPV